MNFFETIQSVSGLVYYSMVIGNKIVTTTRYHADDIDTVSGFWNDLEYTYTSTSLSEKEVDLLLSDSSIYYSYDLCGVYRQVCMYGSSESIREIEIMISLGYFE